MFGLPPSTDGRDTSLPPNHPINQLSPFRKTLILCILSFCGFLANYSIAAIQVAFPQLGGAFGVSPALIPDSIGYNLLGLGIGPFIFNPLSKTLGRRLTYLIGAGLFIPFVIFMALAKTYTTFCVARALAGLVSGWSQTVPPSTIADIFVKEVRGSKMSAYAVMVIIAPSVAPLICGLVIHRYSYRVCFWIVLALAALQFLLLFFFVPETLWIDETSVPGLVGSYQEGFTESKPEKGVEMLENAPGATPGHLEGGASMAPAKSGEIRGHVGMAWKPWERPGEFLRVFLSPFLMFQYLPILLPSIYYGTVFCWSVGITIVWPQLAPKAPYNFSTIAIGCSYAAFGIGGVLGKWSGGIIGDKTVAYFVKQKGYRHPEFRLWAVFPLLPLMFAAAAICGVGFEKKLHWISILIGGALFFFTLSALTGLLQTYVLEVYLPRSQDTQAVFIFWKCIWGFVIAYFVYSWGLNSSFLTEYLVQGALAAGVGAILCAGLILKGHALRKWQGMPISDSA
ncbi:MFS general substrate transporter [Meredithblackwellia eburnea MCA 4105]